MNFLAHGMLAMEHLECPVGALTSMAEDLAPLAGLQLRRDGVGPVLRRGIDHHRRIDAAFHDAAAFTSSCRVVASALRDAGEDRWAAVATAHVLVELLVDGSIPAADRPRRCGPPSWTRPGCGSPGDCSRPRIGPAGRRSRTSGGKRARHAMTRWPRWPVGRWGLCPDGGACGRCWPMSRSPCCLSSSTTSTTSTGEQRPGPTGDRRSAGSVTSPARRLRIPEPQIEQRLIEPRLIDYWVSASSCWVTPALVGISSASLDRSGAVRAATVAMANTVA